MEYSPINKNINAVKVVLNMLAIAPFLCLLTWILCAREEELKGNEKLVRRPVFLVFALVCVGVLGTAFFFPTYRNWDLRLCTWIVMVPFSLIFFSLWWFWRKKVTDDSPEAAGSEEDGEAAEGEEQKKLPEQADYIIKNLPDGISYGEDGAEQQLKEFSRRIPDNAASFPLIALMNGKIPTEDQAVFLDRFSTLYEDTLNNFFESAKPNSEQLLPDIILQGQDGSGRTEALCAAAVYAAVVRGQNVLYIVQDRSYASSLAEKMKSRLRDLLVDSYYTADYLKPNFVGTWLLAEDAKKETADSQAEDVVRQLPPNILFATPEQVETEFFCNDSLTSPEKREILRNIMLGYSVILVDDFLEMPVPLQAHLAFVLDKFRLLQASEYVLGQFVIATAPLQDPYGIDSLAERLFGLAQFNATKNAVMLRPRQCEPYWCGTLWIDRKAFSGQQALEDAAQKLLDVCTEKNYETLFYSKGISRSEAEKLESRYEKKGTVSVSAHLYQLNEEKMPFDTIFYLSLTSGNAAAALRLSLPDDKAGTPVFFRIALVGEAEKPVMAQFALLPNETAISLRAFHLRSVLPFLPRLTPISASVWSHFGISLMHPCCRSANIAPMPDGLVVKWYYDYYSEKNLYGENVIWPYLVLASDAAISNVGKNINFDILPSTKDCILRDKRQADPKGDALVFVSGEDAADPASPVPPQIAIWLDTRESNKIGETDLAHAEMLTLVKDDNRFSVDVIQPPDEDHPDFARCAMCIKSQPRRGLSYDIPVRRFSWNLPDGVAGFSVPDVKCFQKTVASFSIQFGENSFHPISAEIGGMINAMGDPWTSEDPSKARYEYDAFMSCFVFLPEKETCNEAGIRRSLSGNWSTAVSSGFSSPLTHAFSIALRKRIAGLSFFAMTPVFLTDGRDDSFGRLLLWLQEPYNSGCTVYPLLKKLLPDVNTGFLADLLSDVQDILAPDNTEVTLEELRRQSCMAFVGEDDLSPDEWKGEIENGLAVIHLLQDSKALKEDLARREERRKKSLEERERRQAEIVDPTLTSDEEKKQRREFDVQLTADLRAFKDVIDVSRFCLDYGWTVEQLTENFNDFLWNSPEIFYIAKSYHYTYRYEPNGKIISFFFTNLRYGIEKGEYKAVKRKLDEAAAEAMKLLDGVSDPVQKALILHDHIVRICEYDKKACDSNDLSPQARTAYSVLVRHKAVCEGYTMAYRYLLKLAGIRSEEVISDEMEHCWNYLYLDGNWYHVDVTWDDPVYHGRKPDNTKISHEYFLLSDDAIAVKGNPRHHDWDVRGLPPASDTKFDDIDWDSY